MIAHLSVPGTRGSTSLGLFAPMLVSNTSALACCCDAVGATAAAAAAGLSLVRLLLAALLLSAVAAAAAAVGVAVAAVGTCFDASEGVLSPDRCTLAPACVSQSMA